MRYSNPQLPAIVRENIEKAVAALVDNVQLRVYSRCEHNSLDHIALVTHNPVYEAIVQYLFLDVSLADDEVAKLMNQPKGLSTVTRHAAQWLAQAIRDKYPAKKVKHESD